MISAIQILNRQITEETIDEINELIRNEGAKGRTYISMRLCVLWDWRTLRGIYRDIACRDLLRRLDALGLISLPAKKTFSKTTNKKLLRTTGCKRRIKETIIISEETINCSVEKFKEITIRQIEATG